MSEEGASHAPHPIQIRTNLPKEPSSSITDVQEDYPISPSPRTGTPNPFSRKNTSMDIDDYFTGPRDIAKHSKWPLFLQMHGSILPKMVVPLIAVAMWSSLITVISMKLRDQGVFLGVNSILLTVTGFVVGLGLSLRSSTAYERYAEGRRCWSQLTQTTQTLGRVFWIHAAEREDCAKYDILAKLTGMNLLVAFSVSLMHRLRFEPYSYYDDLTDLIDHLDTFAKSATDENVFKPRDPNFFKRAGEHLGVSFATSNPRKAMKKAQSPIGNLPLEIMCYMSAYTDDLVNNGQLPIPMTQTLAYNGIQALNDVLVNTERVLNTPLPIAYTIAISQITWVYVFLLPFQLLPSLEWITIPASVAAAYIILGILLIGREIENPFGNDVNDLPLELYCQQVVQDLETIAARPRARPADWIENSKNKVLFPHSESGYHIWASRPESAIRRALHNRPHNGFDKMMQAATNEKGDASV
ncbi:Bestrophin, RFP-TM, chloride channel-domain-containing protein [Pseudomassariella vexata]|uniref:Bestrophin, RFP-TM, chloride channel-domain-containing protein n=1 Tax=Pseudomassariella vexata TaxID=1141098 RepID=A0A1Y2DR24_9PEZI|nr:Bestrophin, RFP-TM, chloride channel-domain-containing protein [Pseudomassariella vexata]ORY61738.1 Bestrophin, RFP-TM, chloride channel-domain-containing protein [Pseudomassariella vexata]